LAFGINSSTKEYPYPEVASQSVKLRNLENGLYGDELLQSDLF
jgi:hypothetical protein